MLFNSLSFLYGFLPIVYVGFWLLKSRNARYVWLTLSGYWFYAQWNWKFTFLMLFSTLVSFTAGCFFLKFSAQDPMTEKTRKRILIVPIVVDLSLLTFFKYFNFVASNVANLAKVFSSDLQFHYFNIVLPIGISFYTFHTISYIVDSYRRKITPTKNFWEFSCYVSLFSQLVAGPIVRFGEIERSLENVDRDGPLKNLNQAIGFFVIGLSKKVLLADNLSPFVKLGFDQVGSLARLDAWLTIMAYTFQLYFDFSGYSDMAVGLGLLFNLDIPQNFKSPYKATSIRDFWQRWHVSLSSCIRDYIYIPLGGSRGAALSTSRNLLLAMGIAGLWHGANWTFIIWGLFHGSLLLIERAWKTDWNASPLAKRAAVFGLVSMGWVVFRADNMSAAWAMYKNMFYKSGLYHLPAMPGLLALLGVSFFITQTQENTFEKRNLWAGVSGILLVVAFAASVFSVASGESSPFLYFQF